MADKKDNRGGTRPTAPQNNFAVSATGGAGNGGQPNTYVAGMDNAGEYQAIQGAEPLNKSGVTLPTGRGGVGAPVMSAGEPVTPANAPTTMPSQPVSDGAALGAGAGNEALTSSMMLAAQSSDDYAKLAAYLPVYAKIAESPTSTNAMRNFYRFMRSQVDNPQVQPQAGQQ